MPRDKSGKLTINSNDAHAQRAALDLAAVEALQCLFGHCSLDGNEGLEVENRDFPDLGSW
ncbi:hypothetical protein D3C77_743200 [compost metagenome]